MYVCISRSRNRKNKNAPDSGIMLGLHLPPPGAPAQPLREELRPHSPASVGGSPVYVMQLL